VLIGVGLGLFQALCIPPIGWAFLLPACMAGFLILVGGLSVKNGFKVGFLFGLAWYLGDLFWFANIFGPAAVSLCAILAFFTGLFAALYLWIRSRLPAIPGWLLAATLWTGIELFRSELFVLDFGWMGLGYGVVNSPLLAAGASWLGCYGLTFLIVALAALLAGSVSRGRRGLAPAAALLGLWLAAYAIRLPAPAPGRPLRVRLVQANSEDDASLFALSKPPAGSHPDVIVWPEYSFVSDPTRQPAIWRRLQHVAVDNRAYFLFGAKDQFDPANESGYRNTAFLLDPTGRLVGRHVKNHTVHFFRDGVPGKDAHAIPTAFGRLGVAICFDMDYPDVARRLAEDGAEVFLVPNDDPPEWGPVQHIQHRLMFQMRAVECGRWLARADVAGGTSVALPNGAEGARIGTEAPGALAVVVGRLSVKTPFVRGGWLFGRLCLASAVALWMAAVKASVAQRRRGAKGSGGK
jgi:apolipoprotein N-acyltransferase